MGVINKSRDLRSCCVVYAHAMLCSVRPDLRFRPSHSSPHVDVQIVLCHDLSMTEVLYNISALSALSSGRQRSAFASCLCHASDTARSLCNDPAKGNVFLNPFEIEKHNECDLTLSVRSLVRSGEAHASVVLCNRPPVHSVPSPQSHPQDHSKHPSP